MNDWQIACRRIGCEGISNKNSDYCTKHDKELQEKAIDTFGREEWDKAIAEGKNPITILKSNIRFGYTRNSCERCERRFRFWRKRINGFNKTSKQFVEICIDCVTEDDAI